MLVPAREEYDNFKLVNLNKTAARRIFEKKATRAFQASFETISYLQI